MDRLKRRALRRHQAKCFHRYHGPEKPPKDWRDWGMGASRKSKRQAPRKAQRPARVRHRMGFFIPF